MLSRDSWEQRQAEDDLLSRVRGSDRLVDFGVVLRVVVQDPAGQELVIGKPRLRVIREHQFGGVVDTRARPPKFVGPSRRPQTWYCSEAQEPLILHSDSEPPRLLVHGGMGAGKTEVLSMWAWLQIIALTGTALQVGLTAPTEKRAVILRNAMIRRAPAEWFRGGSVEKGWTERRQEFRFANGITAQVLSTHVSSAAEGSRIQGYSWAVCGSDEIQDSIHADDDIESRGRSAVRGVYRRLCTCTPKQSSEWRTFADAKTSQSSLWGLRQMDAFSNPFTWPEYLEHQRQTLTTREYNRRVMGLDMGPELATYFAWARKINLAPLPLVGARDITAKVTGGFPALLGHDPGTKQDATLVLKCFEIKGRQCWWVIDEITTYATTTIDHIQAVTERLRDVWNWQDPENPESGRVLVRIDPQGDSANRTHVTVYQTWKNAGYRALSAAYTNTAKPSGTVPKKARIDMVNRLLATAAGEHRLFVTVREDGSIAAPQLVKAFESAENDANGEPEVKVKHKTDWSHWPAALGYALWPYEREVASRGIRRVGAVF